MPRTVGVEEEFLLVRAESALLSPTGEAAVADASASSDGQFEHELKQEQAELGSSPQESMAALAADLRARRRELGDAAEAQGARLAALATSPMDTHTSTAEVARYKRMTELFGRVARLQLTCGMHVHVSVETPDEGVRVLDVIRPWLPVLLALSASSPYLAGEDTGYASFRSVMWGQWPTAGATEAFGDLAGYESARQALVDSGAALDEGMIYFDARLSARYPTVEIRVADVCPHLEDAVTIAALARALVSRAAKAADPPHLRTDLLRAATWRAARWGVEESLVDVRVGRPVPAWDLVADLLGWIGPALAETGDTELVRSGLAAIRARGTGARLQRDAYAAAGRWRDVVDAVAERTLARAVRSP